MVKRYIKILKAFTAMSFLYGIVSLVPISFVLFYRDEIHYIKGFAITSLLSFSIYTISKLVFKNIDIDEINFKDGVLVTIFSWIFAAFLFAIPHMVEGKLNFSQAVFESVSGLTTTGLTMYTDVTKVSKLVLFWRSWTQYLGGAGFALLMMITILGHGGAGFYKAEGRSDNLVPNIARSVSIIIRIYLLYTLIGTVALRIAGMGWFDALNHTMTALATGGFSTKNGSVGDFNSLAVEIIIMVLMFLGATSFAVHYSLLKGNFRTVLKNGEPWLMMVFVLFFSSFITLYGSGSIFENYASGFRIVSFQLLSAITGTGFQTVNLGSQKYLNFAPFMLFLIIFMLAGGSMDSTSGGIKQFRILVILRSIINSVHQFLLPKGSKVKVVLYKGEKEVVITDTDLKEVLVYFSLFVFSFILGSFILTLHGYSLTQSMFEFASAMDGVGLSTGVTSPDMPLTAMWTLTVGMFAGRFEFLVLLFAITKIINDVYNSVFSKRI